MPGEECFSVCSPKIQTWKSNSWTVLSLFSGSSKALSGGKYDFTEHCSSWSLEALEYPQYYRDKSYVLFCYQIYHFAPLSSWRTTINLPPNLLFGCMLLPLEVFVMVVGQELNLNKLYGLRKFSRWCTDRQLTETTHCVQKQSKVNTFQFLLL